MPNLKDAAKIQNNFGEHLCAVPNKKLVKDKITGMLKTFLNNLTFLNSPY